MYRMSIYEYAKLHEVRIRIGFKFSSSTLLVTQCIRARQLGTALQDSNPHMADGHAYPYMPYHDISAVLHSKQRVPFPFPTRTVGTVGRGV